MSSNNKFKKHIQLPKSLLTELGSSFGNESDNRLDTFNNNNKKRKFSNKNMTRKERRKQERNDKKRKMNSNKNVPQANKNPARKENNFNSNKGKENTKKTLEEEEKIPTDDSLDSEDFDEFDENDLTPEEWKQLRALEGNKEAGSDEESSSSSFSASSSDYDDEELSQSEHEKKVSSKKDLKSSLKQKLAKKVISKNSKKHVSFNKNIMEKLIPARPNYGQPPASSSDEDYDIDEEDDYDDEDSDEYLNQLALSDSEDDEENTQSVKHSGLPNSENLSSEESEEGEKEMSVEETMAALKAVKAKQNKKEKRTKETKSELEYDHDNRERSEEEKEMTVEETMAALKAVKDAKNKSKKKKDTIARDDEETNFEVYEDPESDEDERNIKYYAKKLNIGKKSKKLKAVDEYDAIGGLLEGLDFFESYGENLGDYGELEIKDNDRDLSSSDSESSEESDSESSDEMNGSEQLDEDMYDDFNENDLTPEEWAQLRELEDSELDESESEEEEKPKKKKKKEKSSKNQASLYGLDTELDDEDKMAIETLENDMSNVNQQLTKTVKMLFIKLSESNINNIIASLLEVFELNPRQTCINSIIIRIIIDCDIHEKLLDQFLMNYIGCVYALWKFKGIEFGAYFIQRLVEKIIYNLEIVNVNYESTNKNNSNLISLLAFSFNFGIITNKLIYNLLDFLADISSEAAVELIFKCISISGVLLRGENPKALNLVINKLLSNLQAADEEEEDDSRLQFLVDTLKDLRLNKINKNLITKTNHLQMKKSITKSLKIDLKTLGGNSSQAIQVSLDDILNIDTKGKWWLIGGSYRENMINSGLQESEAELNEDNMLDQDIEFSDIELHDDFIDELPDYNKLAIQNKMASPLSKAIFVGITSAQDPLDCIMRLDKLDIKKKNYQELVRVLLHVSKLDANYNPFYELIAIRLSKNMQGLNKFMKFHFWDVIKNFETNNEDDDKETILNDLYGDFGSKRDGKIVQEARLFGNLIFDKIIPFDVFKHVSILDGLSVDGELFVNSLLYQLLLRIGKESEKKQTKKNSSSSKTLLYDIKIMEEIVFNTIQPENELIILKQLQWYAENKLNISKFAFTNDKTKEKRRVKWALNAFKELMDQKLKHLE